MSQYSIAHSPFEKNSLFVAIIAVLFCFFLLPSSVELLELQDVVITGLNTIEFLLNQQLSFNTNRHHFEFK